MAAPRICSVEDCDNPANGSRGYCVMHYGRFSRHGDPTIVLTDYTPRGEIARYLEETVFPCTSDDCLIWPFKRDTQGRARVKDGGRWALVSRVVCRECHGEPPTPKHDCAHNCGKGHLGCINPNHLRWATHVENEADKIKHGTLLVGERNAMAKLSNAQVLAIKRQRGRRTFTAIADEYGVSVSLISMIMNDKRRTIPTI